MRVYQGRSERTDTVAALEEAVRSFDVPPQVLFLFASSRHDPAVVSAFFAGRFPGVPIAGCTTAGESLGAAHSTGGLAVAGLVDPSLRVAVETVRDLASFDAFSAAALVEELALRVGAPLDALTEGRGVCLLFVDGLRGVEEALSAHLAEALEGVRMAGGSAGDDLAFRETFVYGPEGAASDAAVVVLVRSTDGTPIQLVKHQHFTPGGRLLCVTRAEGRTVHTLDGRPALEAYAAALGLTPGEVTSEVTFQHPVTFTCHGELYVRAIQKLDPATGAMTFFCAVEEGLVLDVGTHTPMVAALSSDLAQAFEAPPAFVLGFNCILRALEATGSGAHPALGALQSEACGAWLGFDTYGEQLDGLHINQTLVAVGFGRRAA